jgi:hypothetical protein
MTDVEADKARAAVIMLAGVAFLVLGAIVFLRPMPGDCAIFPNGVVDCGPPRDVTIPLLLGALGCVAFGSGLLFLGRIHVASGGSSVGHVGLSKAAREGPKGFRGWWRLRNIPSPVAVPVQMTFMGGVVIAFGLLLAWVSPGPILGPVGLLLLGALWVYGGLRRIQEDRLG